jgi:rhodanese-related sulfurtransferase
VDPARTDAWRDEPAVGAARGVASMDSSNVVPYLTNIERDGPDAAPDGADATSCTTNAHAYMHTRDVNLPIRQLSAPELQAMIDNGEPFELVDVRTDEERAVASIEGSRLLDRAYHDELLQRDRDTPLVFQCHHGVRSQQAAEYFQQHGFRNLSNLQGGIDAWSLLVDPSVMRY